MRSYIRAMLGLGALAVLAGVLAYFGGAFHPKVPESATLRPFVFDGEPFTVSATESPLTETVPGTIQATDETIISSRIMANVLRVNVRAGDQISEGKLLVELDGEALAAVLEQRAQEVESAAAILDEARLTRDRVSSLYESRNISRAEYDRAMTQWRKASADRERARRAVVEAETALGYTRIRAPMSGVIVERFTEPGDTAAPGQALLKLFNPGRLRVEATLRESLIQHVHLDDVLEARIDALDDSVSTVVDEIVPSADPGSRTFTLKARMPRLEGLFPGMFARLEIPFGTEPRLLIPQAAVQRAGQLTFVYVRTPRTDTRRFVRLGATIEGRVIVNSGLDVGETILIPN